MTNNKQSMYKDALMHHFRHPYKKQVGTFSESFVSARGRNPKCGDDVEVGIEFSSFETYAKINEVGFRGRGCSVCLASASMMVKAIEKMELQQALDLADTMDAWVGNRIENEQDIPSELHPLEVVQDHPARKKCVMLGWNALKEIIQSKMGSAL